MGAPSAHQDDRNQHTAQITKRDEQQSEVHGWVGNTNLARLPLKFRTLVVRCWDSNPNLRPTFGEISRDLEGMLRSFESKEMLDESTGNKSREAESAVAKGTGNDRA